MTSPSPAPTLPDAQLTHVGVYVRHLDAMVEFYCRTLGLLLNDLGDMNGRRLAFLSRSPNEHHHVVLAHDPQREMSGESTLNQLSFRVGGLRELRHLVEALRMARHQQPGDGAFQRRAVLADPFEEARLLALARAGEHDHRPARSGPPGAATFQQRGIGPGVELEVAQHATDAGAGLFQAAGVVLRLRPHRRQAPVGRARQRRQAQRLAQ